MKRIITMLTAFLVSLLPAEGQEMMTFERAMEFALENSPIMRQFELALVRNQEKLNAQLARQKSQFGLQVDPFTYERSNRFDRRFSEWFISENASSSGTFTVNQRVVPTNGTVALRNTFSYDYYKSGSAGAEDPISRTWNNRLDLVVDQPIFTYNRMKVELEQVTLAYEASLIRYLLQKLSLEREVARSFYQVYTQQMSLQIANEALANNTESHEIIKNKVDGGLLALEELYQAEVNLATSRSNVLNAELGLQNSMDNLKVIIGMPVEEEFVIVTEVQADTIDIDQGFAIDHALMHRMELREREIDIRNSEFALLNAKTVNEFAGSVSASIGITSNTEELSELMNTPTNTPSVGLSFNIPIYDWGERKSEIRAAEADLESTRIDKETEQIDIKVTVRSTVRNLQNLKNQIIIQNKTVDNAQLAYEINLERYKNGDLTSFDLGQFQNQLSDQKMALTNALINYKLELLNLKVQTLYDFENDMAVIPEGIVEDNQ